MLLYQALKGKYGQVLSVEKDRPLIRPLSADAVGEIINEALEIKKNLKKK